MSSESCLAMVAIRTIDYDQKRYLVSAWRPSK